MIHKLLLLVCFAALAACHPPPEPPVHTATTATACDDGNPCTAVAELGPVALHVFELRAGAVLPELAAAAADHTERLLDMVAVPAELVANVCEGGDPGPAPLIEHALIIGRQRPDRAASQQVVKLARISHSPRSTVWLC